MEWLFRQCKKHNPQSEDEVAKTIVHFMKYIEVYFINMRLKSHINPIFYISVIFRKNKKDLIGEILF